jgi:hypothetical protein
VQYNTLFPDAPEEEGTGEVNWMVTHEMISDWPVVTLDQTLCMVVNWYVAVVCVLKNICPVFVDMKAAVLDCLLDPRLRTLLKSRRALEGFLELVGGGLMAHLETECGSGLYRSSTAGTVLGMVIVLKAAGPAHSLGSRIASLDVGDLVWHVHAAVLRARLDHPWAYAPPSMPLYRVGSAEDLGQSE